MTEPLLQLNIRITKEQLAFVKSHGEASTYLRGIIDNLMRPNQGIEKYVKLAVGIWKRYGYTFCPSDLDGFCRWYRDQIDSDADFDIVKAIAEKYFIEPINWHTGSFRETYSYG